VPSLRARRSSTETICRAGKGEWNLYRIVCQGSEITLYVNGERMCQFTDLQANGADSEGVIALQMHPGPPMKVQFRNIVLKERPAGK